jgi:hypothetical protein
MGNSWLVKLVAAVLLTLSCQAQTANLIYDKIIRIALPTNIVYNNMIISNSALKGVMTYQGADKAQVNLSGSFALGLKQVGTNAVTAVTPLSVRNIFLLTNTIAAATIPPFVLVNVQGYSSENDGGGGQFYLDLASVATVDFGMVFPADDATFVWKRLWEGGDVNARWFGAKGDGSNDDVQEVQAAIDFVASVGGGIVNFPPGRYRFATNGLQVMPLITLTGPEGFYSQDQAATNRIFAPGVATIFTDDPTANFSLITVSGTNGAALGYQPVLAATLNDGSYATNWPVFVNIKGLSLTACTSNSLPLGTNNVNGLFLDRCVSVRVEGCSFIYLSGFPIRTWACNILSLSDINGAGLGGRGLFLDQTADSYITDTDVGGSRGPAIWLRGNKNSILNNFWFNTVLPTYLEALAASVDIGANTITITNARTPPQHYLQTGDPVTFQANSGTLPAPLQEGVMYYAIRTTYDTFGVNTQYEQGAVGGAMQGVMIDLTTTGSGDWTTELHGPTVNAYIHGVQESLWVDNRIDQSQEAGLEIRNSSGITFVGNQAQESGWLNTNYTGAQMLLYGSTNNTITGNRFAKRAATRYALGGVGFMDAVSSANIVSANSFDAGITTNYVYYGGKIGGSFSYNQNAIQLRPDAGNSALGLATEINGYQANFTNYNSTTPAVGNRYFAAKGTEASPAALSAFETAQDNLYYAYNGSGYNVGARYRVNAYEAQTSTNTGMYHLWGTSLGTTAYNSFQIDGDTSASQTAISVYVNGSIQRVLRDPETGALYISAINMAPAFTTLTDTNTITWTMQANKTVNNAKVILGGNRTLDIVGEVGGMTGVLEVVQPGSGGPWTLTLPGSSKVVNGGAGAITLSTAANAIDVLSFVYDGSSFFWTFGKNFN